MIIKYTSAWFGMMVLAVLNGALRDIAYKPYIGDLPAHQISTITLIALFTLYFWLLGKKWPIPSAAQAWTIGTIWFVMTEAFEVGMGLMRNASWDDLLHAYDVASGQVWIVIPLWVLVGPYLFFRFRRST